MNAQELRDALRSRVTISNAQFVIAKALCDLTNDGDERVARELLLRALEHREVFGSCSMILDGLARDAGLFPYLDPETLDFQDRVAFEFHRPPGLEDRSIVFHRPQARIFRELMSGRSVILSAPTSFGKSLIIDAMLASKRFQNILVVVPTIALIDETRRRLSNFRGDYKIITHPFQEPSDRNVFVLTQERALELPFLAKIDFFVIDEFYKLSPSRDSEDRWTLLNQLFYKLTRRKVQFYMLGPAIIDVAPELKSKVECTFVVERYTTVVTEEHRVDVSNGEDLALINLCKTLDGPTIVFCRSPQRAADTAKLLASNNVGSPNTLLANATDWIEKNYHPNWHFCEALKRGIAVHHGRIPRALGQFAVRKFNEGIVKLLVCTSTLIEGVNTKAENIIILDNEINREKLDFFTFNNIRGRGGRMFQHFVGHVYMFHEPPQEDLPFVDVPAFSQNDLTPDSLLLQLDHRDLKPRSIDRLKVYAEQGLLTLETLRANVGIDPERQVAIAETIVAELGKYAAILQWKGYPTYDQLLSISELIWNHFDAIRLGARSARSAKQLATRVRHISNKQSIPEQVSVAINFVQDNDPDLAVQSVLDFQRLWANFHFPRLLRAISNIQRDILGRRDLPFGDYEAYASRVECLFLDRGVFALDEYGIPLPLARKLERLVSVNGNLDATIEKLSGIDFQKYPLHPFELELIEDAQKYL